MVYSSLIILITPNRLIGKKKKKVNSINHIFKNKYQEVVRSKQGNYQKIAKFY